MANTSISIKDPDDAAHSFVLLPITGPVGRRIDTVESTPDLPVSLEVSGSVATPTAGRKFSALRASVAYSHALDADVTLWGVAPVASVRIDVNLPFGTSDGTSIGTSAEVDPIIRKALFYFVQVLRGYDDLSTAEVTDLDAILGSEGALFSTISMIAQGDR